MISRHFRRAVKVLLPKLSSDKVVGSSFAFNASLTRPTFSFFDQLPVELDDRLKLYRNRSQYAHVVALRGVLFGQFFTGQQRQDVHGLTVDLIFVRHIVTKLGNLYETGSFGT